MFLGAEATLVASVKVRLSAADIGHRELGEFAAKLRYRRPAASFHAINIEFSWLVDFFWNRFWLLGMAKNVNMNSGHLYSATFGPVLLLANF
jgi:hypothetical protein